MDPTMFDTLVRFLSRTPSRRAAARHLVGSFLAAWLGQGASPAPIAAKKGGKGKKRKKQRDRQPLPAPPPSLCPQPANPHWCAGPNICVPACPSGTVFDPLTCMCPCRRQMCCLCSGGSNPFCSHAYATNDACAAACAGQNPDGGALFFGGSGMTVACAPGHCAFTCQPDSCAGVDACLGSPGNCFRGGQCYQPLGGGPTRCGVPTPTGSCGCTSHQQCADAHGPGAFCVTFDPEYGFCTCGEGGPTTFCALPR
jgi:hypothetical protein